MKLGLALHLTLHTAGAKNSDFTSEGVAKENSEGCKKSQPNLIIVHILEYINKFHRRINKQIKMVL